MTRWWIRSGRAIKDVRVELTPLVGPSGAALTGVEVNLVQGAHHGRAIVEHDVDLPGGGLLEPGEHPGDRRLARAGLTHQSHGAPGEEVERDVVDGPEALPAELLAHREVLGQVLDLDARHTGSCSVCVSRPVRMKLPRLPLRLGKEASSFFV